MGLLRSFLNANTRLSEKVDSAFPASMKIDGAQQFMAELLPQVLQPGATIWDVGSGSRPFISPEQRSALNLRIVGTDISAEELKAAPAGSYDEVIVADLCTYEGRADADFIICKAIMEHVPDNREAMRALTSIVRPGGRILIFAPCRNALFARLNLWLPEGVKQKVLFAVFPNKAEGHDGFKAFYNRCVPREFEAMAKANGLEIEERRLYWISSYFKPFVPAFIGWRMYQGVSRLFIGDQAAETFAYVLRKPE